MGWFGECHELVHGFIKQQLTHELLIHPFTHSLIHHDINIVAVNYLYIYLHIIFVYRYSLFIPMIYSCGEWIYKPTNVQRWVLPGHGQEGGQHGAFDKWLEAVRSLGEVIVETRICYEWLSCIIQHLTWLFWSFSNKVREL